MFLQVHLVCLLVTLAALMSGLEGACKYKGKQICEGAVTKVTKKFVRICTEGKVLKKKKEEVEPGYPMAGGGIITSNIIWTLIIVDVFRMCLVWRCSL